MIGKIVNNKVITPPHNDGNKFNVHLNAEWLEANGFRELTTEEVNTCANLQAQANALAQERFATLDVDRAIRALGQGDTFDAFLNAEGNEVFKREFTLTPIINLNDPSVVLALETGSFNVDTIKLKIAGLEANND